MICCSSAMVHSYSGNAWVQSWPGHPSATITLRIDFMSLKANTRTQCWWAHSHLLQILYNSPSIHHATNWYYTCWDTHGDMKWITKNNPQPVQYIPIIYFLKINLILFSAFPLGIQRKCISSKIFPEQNIICISHVPWNALHMQPIISSILLL